MAVFTLGLVADVVLNPALADHRTTVIVVSAGVWALALSLALWGARTLFRIHEHPDWRALARYGQPAEVAAVIDAEIEDGEQVAAVGRPVQALRLTTWRTVELNGCQALVTPSWLVYLWGPEDDRVTVMRLEDLVVVHRAEANVVSPYLGAPVGGSRAIFIDRHKFRLEVAGTVDGVGRLVAHVLTRVPWALTRFDPDTERSWRDNPEQIIAAVDQVRREQSG
jgi:hypothetical protein